MDWFPMWHKTLDNRKVQALPGELFKSWCNLMMLAARLDENGKLPNTDDISFALRITVQEATDVIEKLVELKFIDYRNSHKFIHDWNYWQIKSFSSRKRTAEWRRRHRDVTVTLRPVTVTSPSRAIAETETETETETERESDSPPLPPKKGGRKTTTKFSKNGPKNQTDLINAFPDDPEMQAAHEKMIRDAGGETEVGAD